MSNLRDNKLDSLSTNNHDMKGRRTINASPSQDPNDYIINRELTNAVDKLNKLIEEASTIVDNFITIDKIPVIYNGKSAKQLNSDFKGDHLSASMFEIDRTGATDCSIQLQALIDKQHSGASGPIILTPGKYLVQNLKVYANTHIEGQRTVGSFDPDIVTSWPGMAILVQSPGCNKDVIKTNDQIGSNFAHGLILQNLDIIGDPATNSLGNGLNLFQLGENSIIDSVRISRMPENGLYIHGSSAPLHLGSLSFQENIGNGILIDANSTATNQIDFLSGDNNGGALLKIQNSGTTTVTIWGFKAERSNNILGVGHNIIFDLNNTPDLDLIIGSGQIYWDNIAAVGTAIIRQTGASKANIQIVGSIRITQNLAAYSYGYQDVTNGRTISLDDFTSSVLSGPLQIRQKITGSRDLLRIHANSMALAPPTNDAPAWFMDFLGHLINLGTSPANPNSSCWNNINFGVENQGGFFSINSKYIGGSNWTKIASAAYSGAMFLRLAAKLFEIRFGNATNTDGADPGSVAFGVNTAATGNVCYNRPFIGQTTSQWEWQDSSGTAQAWIDSDQTYKSAGRRVAFGAITITDSPYTPTGLQDFISCDATGGAISIVLPTAIGQSGRRYVIEKSDNTANSITLTGFSGQTINGSSSYVLALLGQYITIVSNNLDWQIFSVSAPVYIPPISSQNIVTGSRAFTTTYQNTSTKPMCITVTGSTISGIMTAFTDASNPPLTVVGINGVNGSGATVNIALTFWVLPNNYYKVTTAGGANTLACWTEWI